jgi:hypothetical protein
MMKRVDIRPIQRDPILRAELKARYWGGRVGELSLGDVLLAGPRAVALLEFKREANWKGRWKEHSKLLKIEDVLEHPKFENLRDTPKQIHFYVETRDILEEGSKSRVLPYLELRTDDRRSNLEQLIDNRNRTSARSRLSAGT